MCEKTKPAEEIEGNEAENQIENDQTERSYYYDDACGYQVYVDEDDAEISPTG